MGRAVQSGVKLLHGLVPAAGLDFHAAEQSVLLLRRQLHSQIAGRDELILQDAVQRLGRHLAGEAVIDGCGERVHVRPGPLALALILLDGRVALLEGDGHGFGAPGGFPGAAEVEQPHGSPLKHQVVGADVAVDQTGGMDGAQRGKQGLNEGKQLSGRDPPAALGGQLHEIGALHILHHDIGGVVGLEIVADHDDLRLLFHARHGAGLVQEALEPLVIILRLGSHPADHRQGGLGEPGDPVDGEIFLDGHFHFQTEIAADVGDAEAALAQGAPDQIASSQDRAQRQMVGGGRVRALGQPADGAALSRGHPAHAVGTEAFLLLRRTAVEGLLWFMGHGRSPPFSPPGVPGSVFSSQYTGKGMCLSASDCKWGRFVSVVS